MRLTGGLAEREKDTQIAQEGSIMSFLRKPALNRDHRLMYESYLRINQHLWVIAWYLSVYVMFTYVLSRRIQSEHLHVYVDLRPNMELLVWICVRACMHVCLCVLFYICPQPDGRLEETPISPVLLVPDNVRRRYDSSWEEASPLIPPTFPPSLPFPSLPPLLLSLSAPVMCLCAWLSSLD